MNDVVHKYLSHGMEVCLDRSDFAPLVSMQVWVKTGSIDECEGEEGLAHVLEHMLFKGTKKFPISGQVASLVESAGGDINAYTTFDHTVYYFTAPSGFALEGARLLLDVVQNSLLDENELMRELEVILEEIRQSRDNPMSRVSQSIFHSLFSGTPLGRPVIGFEEVVKNFTREKVLSFYKRWYTPNNMIFIATGDFAHDDLLAVLHENSESFPPLSVPERIRPDATAVTRATLAERVNVFTGPYQEARVNVSVRAPGFADDKAAAWDMLSGVLGGSDSSRLSRSVKDDQGLVTNIDTLYYSPRYPFGIFGLVFFAQAQSAPAALAAALRELLRLSESGPTRDELARILSSVQASRIYSRESVEGIARSLGHSLQTAQKLGFEEHYVEQLKAVSVADVQTLARDVVSKLREGAYASAVALARESEGVLTPSLIQEIVSDALGESTLKQMGESHRLRSRASQRNSEVRQLEFDLPSNKKLHINFRQSNRLPIMSGMWAVRGGGSLESANKAGVSLTLSEMLTRGTTKQSYKQFVDELDDRASSVGAFSSRDIFGMRMDCLKENGPRTLQMMLDCIFRPAFLEVEFSRVKRESLEVLRAQKDRAGFRLNRLSGPLLFHKHPYANPVSGTEESIDSLSVEDIRGRWLQLFSANEFVFSFAGDFELDALVDVCFKEFDFFLSSLGNIDFPSHAVLSAPDPLRTSDTRFAFDVFEREQAHVSLLMHGVPLRDERRTALEMATTILGGQGGRLFMDLRDKRSLAYALGASQSPNLLSGTFSAYIGTASHKVHEAAQGLKEHIEQLAAEPPSDEELLRAQRSLLGVQSMDAQHTHFQSSQLALSDVYGLGFDNFLRFEERVLKVTKQDVSAVLCDLVRNNPPVLCIVGPEGSWRPDSNASELLSWSKI